MDSAAARIVLDVSTSLGFRLSPPNKYTRVEHALIKELNANRDRAVAVCRDGATFVCANGAVAPGAEDHVDDRVKRLIGACIGRINSFGRDDARHWKPFDHLVAAAAPFAFEASDLVLLAGASWNHLDLTGLRKLKERVGFTLVGLVYDLLPIRYPSFITVDGRRRYREFLLELAGLADLIVTPGATVAGELRDFLCRRDVPATPRIATLSLTVAALRSNDGAASWRLKRHGLHQKRFALCVAPLRKREHLLWLYSLWAELWETSRDAPVLVCAGARPEPDLLALLRTNPLWGKAGKFYANPSDAELHWLYAQSLFCLHPSFEGGLGLPVCEALNHGKLCICADAVSLVEAGEGLPVHLPQDREAWLAAIRKFIAATPGDMFRRDPRRAPRPILGQILEQLAIPADDVSRKPEPETACRGDLRGAADVAAAVAPDRHVRRKK